jgi:hypothetical protein
MSCLTVSNAVYFRLAQMRCLRTFISLIGVMQPRDIHPVHLLHEGYVQLHVARRAMRPDAWVGIDDVELVVAAVLAHPDIFSPATCGRRSAQQ